MAITKAQFKKIALSFPGALEKRSYGNPSIFIEKKFFTRLRSEDDSIVLIVDSIDEREMMIESDAKTFHITEHYRDYPSVLVRIARIDAKTLRGMLERRWRKIAPKKLIKAAEAKPDVSSPARRATRAEGRGPRARASASAKRHSAR